MDKGMVKALTNDILSEYAEELTVLADIVEIIRTK